MRVVINGLATLKPKTGVGHHVANLTRALAERFPGDEFWLYPGDRLARVVRRFNRTASGPGKPVGPKSSVRRLIGRATSLAKRAGKATSRYQFNVVTRASGFDLYHEPNFVPFPSRLPTVVTVHDLSVLRFPDWHPADRVKFHRDRFVGGIRRAAHVIAVSEAVRAELIADLALPPDRVSAVHNGISPAFRVREAGGVQATLTRLGLPPRYLLCVGTIEPRKNIGTAMRAFADLPGAVRSECPLVLVGPWGWRSDAERDYFEAAGKARGIRHLGYVADEDLPAVYSAAAGLVYPSHYEGFGLPPVEMLACGGRVVASSIPAVREVCGPFCETVEPYDLEGWRTAMHRLATDRDFRREHRDAGIRHAGQYTWDRAAEQTMAVYRQAIGLTSRPATPPSSDTSSRPAA